MTASATTQPSRNSNPFTLARHEKSISVTAIIGTGLIATPTAYVRISLIPLPTESTLGRDCNPRSIDDKGHVDAAAEECIVRIGCDRP